MRIAPRFVFSASEVLTDATRALARQAWTIRPFNVYGATETSGVAADCNRHPGMHLFEDLVLTEVVDEHHRPVPPGTFGAKVLVTVLFSRTLPLIRYEMSDSVRLAADQRCGCGRPYRLLDAIQGREQDALRFPGLDGTGSRVVQPIVFHHVMDDVAAAGWQIAQRGDGHLDVLLARPREVDPEALATRLRSALTARGAVAPAVRIQTVDAIPRTPLGKAPLDRRPHRSHTPIGFTWMPSGGIQGVWKGGLSWPATSTTRTRCSSGCAGSRVRCAGCSGWSSPTPTASTS